jgi:multidrug transporter EmrE-like cation transporter
VEVCSKALTLDLRIHYGDLSYSCTMINTVTTRFVYVVSLKWVMLGLSVLLGAPFFHYFSSAHQLEVAVVFSLLSGLAFSLPIVTVLQALRQSNRFWRLLGETRELLSEAQNLSDVNWIRNGHFSDLQRLLGSAKTREANLQMVAELHRLQVDIEEKHRAIMGYYER